MEAVIETRGLEKTYRVRRRLMLRPVKVVRGVDLVVEPGEIHGFLGPNGSGKTTTLRMLVGLARPTAGEVRLFGQPVPDQLAGVIGRVGAVIESPKFFGLLTGRRNLALLASSGGIASARMDAALERVGLADAGGARFATYSLGMKQRLALAAVLMRQPELLILDEPTNGLDPVGMRDMRTLLGELRADGVTVLLSTHVLTDVQDLCDNVTILDKGRVVATGSVEGLLRDARPAVVLEVDDVESAIVALRRAGIDAVRAAASVVRIPAGERPERAVAVLARAGVLVYRVAPEDLPLERAFLDAVARSGSDGAR